MNQKQNRDKEQTVPSASAAAAARTRRPIATPRTKPSTPVTEKTPAVSRPAETEAGSPAYTAEQQLSREDIARLAYSLWQARGCPIGNSEEDWLRAEQELRRRTTADTVSR